MQLVTLAPTLSATDPPKPLETTNLLSSSTVVLGQNKADRVSLTAARGADDNKKCRRNEYGNRVTPSDALRRNHCRCDCGGAHRSGLRRDHRQTCDQPAQSLLCRREVRPDARGA